MFESASAFYCDKYESESTKGVCVYVCTYRVSGETSPWKFQVRYVRRHKHDEIHRVRVDHPLPYVVQLGLESWKQRIAECIDWAINYEKAVPSPPAKFPSPPPFPIATHPSSPDESTDRELRHVQLFVISWGHWPRSCLSLTWSIAVLHGEIHSCARKLRRRYNLAGEGASVSLYTVLAVSLIFLNP